MKAASPIRNSADLDDLRRQIQPLVGELCWRARLAYADELKLDIGAKVPYKSAKMKGLRKGSWTLGSRGTSWTLDSEEGTISSRSRRSIIEASLRELRGVVTAVSIGYRQLDLQVRFENNWILTIEHRPGQPTYDLPYWEVFTPKGACIRAGPGRRWSKGRLG